MADERLTAAFTAQIREELAKAPMVSEQTLVCFRGRPFKNEVPTALQMGPPPAGSTRHDNRYSRKDRPDLYLSDSVEGVRREMAHNDCQLWVQVYGIPAATLRIGDLTPASTEPSLSQILWFADLGGEEGQPDRVGQEVSELARKMFNGILVPGVHGDEEFLYHNIVMFEPDEKRWQSWLKADRQPCRLT
jgi:hypothetical protein